MFGVGPTELAFFLVIVLLAVGPEKLPTFMRTVGKGLRQVRSASRDFKDAIGLDDLMREGDPFRAPPVRPPTARPLPAQDTKPPPVPKTPPPPPPESLTSAKEEPVESRSETQSEAEAGNEPKHP
jgi:Sec-independent protein translocase protein TatA